MVEVLKRLGTVFVYKQPRPIPSVFLLVWCLIAPPPAPLSSWPMPLSLFFFRASDAQAKMNQKRPRNLARLASATVNLANLQSAHAQLVKQKDLVAVICLLCTHHKLIEVCIN